MSWTYCELDRFYPSVAKGIADRILQEELNGQVYDEDDSKHWGLLLSDKIRAAVRGTAYSLPPINHVLILDNCISFTESLKDTRYKIIVQTTIGQLKDQGVRVASRCLWDPNFDNYASTSFVNVSTYDSICMLCDEC
jgi:hypothetical protein